MPSRIPQAVLTRAQQVLSPTVLGSIEKNPGAMLEQGVWSTLSPEQRAMVRQVRSTLTDGFVQGGGAPRRNRNALTGELANQQRPVTNGDGGIPTQPKRVPGDTKALELIKASPAPEMDVTAYKGVHGQSLRNMLRSTQGPGRVLDYSRMRDEAYTYVFNRSGRLLDHYTGQLKEANADPTNYNWEHIFAQSWNGLKGSIWRAHAFNGVPTDQLANNIRASYPFGEVVEATRTEGYVTVGLDKNGATVAQLDPAVRGDIALRALWMYTEAPEFLPKDNEFMLPTLVKWFVDDPPTAQDMEDIGRAEQIEEETLYYAHCPRDLVLRAFVDVLDRHQNASPQIKALYDEAMALVARDEGP